MLKRFAIATGLLIAAGLSPLAAASAEAPVCQLAGINQDGGYIDCAGTVGPARIVSTEGERPIVVTLEVNDETPLEAEVWTNPDGSVFAIVLYDSAGMLAYGMTRPAGQPNGVDVPTSATAAYGDTLELYAPCTFAFDQGPHWCR